MHEKKTMSKLFLNLSTKVLLISFTRPTRLERVQEGKVLCERRDGVDSRVLSYASFQINYFLKSSCMILNSRCSRCRGKECIHENLPKNFLEVKNFHLFAFHNWNNLFLSLRKLAVFTFF